MNSTNSYYNQKASGYDQFRQTGIVGYLVKKEKEMLFSILSLKKEENILDAGCGSGLYANEIQSKGGIPFGIDISPEMIDIYKKKGFNGIVGDLSNFNLNKKYTKILCAGPLEFVPDQVNLFNCLVNHLLENGELFCLFPRFNIFGLLYKLYHLKNKISIYLYSQQTIESIANNHSLEIVFQKNPDPLTTLVVFKKK